MRRWPALIAIAAMCAGLSANAQQQPAALATYARLDPGQVTVSGISSGGFFAHQLHVAHSGLITGAAVLAGGPYGCAEQVPIALSLTPYASVIVALGTCARSGRVFPWTLVLPEQPSAEAALALIRAEHAAGRIDDPANLRDDRVWLFTGANDEVVPVSTMQVLEASYRGLGLAPPALRFVRDGDANHGVPIEQFTGTSTFPPRACDEYGPPFLIDCDFDAAGRLLQHLYPTGFAGPAIPARAHLLAFDQTEFFDPGVASISLAETGYVYVPAACQDDAPPGAACRLHVAFHGCQQSAQMVDDDFVWDAGYNGFAEANRIVVLYPQTTTFERWWDVTGLAGNPKGCWDWWGYSGTDYYVQSGGQIRAVRAMIDRLLAD